MRLEISQEQFALLQGFMHHCWAVFHEKEKSNFPLWAIRLDNGKISWQVQNIAAHTMQDRANGFRYFREVLKEKGIKIK